jgi:hypothetical protein
MLLIGLIGAAVKEAVAAIDCRRKRAVMLVKGTLACKHRRDGTILHDCSQSVASKDLRVLREVQALMLCCTVFNVNFDLLWALPEGVFRNDLRVQLVLSSGVRISAELKTIVVFKGDLLDLSVLLFFQPTNRSILVPGPLMGVQLKRLDVFESGGGC